jgi:uncharacterized repeat protein (TIGR01451 family)
MNMKRWSIGLSTIVLLGVAPFLMSAPVLASLQKAGEAIAQTLRRPDVRLQLAADKQMSEQDLGGKTKTFWQALQGNATVRPGDVLRYTVTGQNVGKSPAKNLAITQPIPQRMAYVLDSAANISTAKTLYSIDNGQNFVEQPMIQVTLADGQVELRPAPAEAYTHVRWQFAEKIDPNATVQAAYQVKVR